MPISYKDLGPTPADIMYDAFGFISNCLRENPRVFGQFIKDHVAMLADQLGCQLVDGRGVVNGELVKTNSLEKDLSTILNCHSEENKSNTPDFILANFILESLKNFHDMIRVRDRWKGIDKPHATLTEIKP